MAQPGSICSETWTELSHVARLLRSPGIFFFRNKAERAFSLRRRHLPPCAWPPPHVTPSPLETKQPTIQQPPRLLSLFPSSSLALASSPIQRLPPRASASRVPRNSRAPGIVLRLGDELPSRGPRSPASAAPPRPPSPPSSPCARRRICDPPPAKLLCPAILQRQASSSTPPPGAPRLPAASPSPWNSASPTLGCPPRLARAPPARQAPPARHGEAFPGDGFKNPRVYTSSTTPAVA